MSKRKNSMQRSGGLARAASLTPEQRHDIAVKAGLARQAKRRASAAASAIAAADIDVPKSIDDTWDLAR